MHQIIDKDDQGISIPLLKDNTTIIIEAGASLYEIIVVRAHERLLLIWSTNPALKSTSPTFAHYIESRRVQDGMTLSDWVVKGERMVLRREGGLEFISEPVDYAMVQGKGWKYEAIK